MCKGTRMIRGSSSSNVFRKLASWIENKGVCFLGRPKKFWFEVLKDDIRANGLTAGDAQDRVKRSRKYKNANPGFRIQPLFNSTMMIMETLDTVTKNTSNIIF